MNLHLSDPGLRTRIVEIPHKQEPLDYLDEHHMSGFTFAWCMETGLCWSRTVNCTSWGKGSIPQRLGARLTCVGWEQIRAWEYDGLSLDGMVEHLSAGE